MKDILTVFVNYTGAGFLTILYLLTLFYLWVAENNPTIRAIFVYGASILQTLFFFPLFYYGYQILDRGTYYRILWLLPMTMTIAYAAVKILARYPAAAMLVGMSMVVLCGQFVYSNPYITPAENAYHIPQEAIDICDRIMPEDGQERVTAVFPDDLIHFIRQYTSEIQMPYGRDYLAPDWIYGDHPLREEMNQGEISASHLVRLATEYQCHYIIVKKDKKIVGNLEKLHVSRISETANYYIYRNRQVEIQEKIIKE